MTFTVLLGEQPQDFLANADSETERIVKDNLSSLGEDPDPRPVSGSGDREIIVIDGRKMYWYHIGRAHTAFYTIHDDERPVRVREILPTAIDSPLETRPTTRLQ